MQHYRSLDDLHPLSEADPELWREVYGFMSICLYEDEEVDLQFLVATGDDTDQLATLAYSGGIRPPIPLQSGPPVPEQTGPVIPL
jgi:hypothetical protein